MKTHLLLGAALLILATSSTKIWAQSEGGNSVPSGGGTGVSGTVSQNGAGTGNARFNGGKNSSGPSITSGATNAPSGGEYAPPQTSASR